MLAILNANANRNLFTVTLFLNLYAVYMPLVHYIFYFVDISGPTIEPKREGTKQP